jgi:hypothetical protein
MREEFRVAKIWIEEIEITKRLVYSVILHLFILLRIWKLSMKSVLFNFDFELMLLFTEYFRIFQERFRSSLLHYWYMDGILTVARACPETQLDYSNYSAMGYLQDSWRNFKNHISEIHSIQSNSSSCCTWRDPHYGRYFHIMNENKCTIFVRTMRLSA